MRLIGIGTGPPHFLLVYFYFFIFYRGQGVAMCEILGGVATMLSPCILLFFLYYREQVVAMCEILGRVATMLSPCILLFLPFYRGQGVAMCEILGGVATMLSPYIVYLVRICIFICTVPLIFYLSFKFLILKQGTHLTFEFYSSFQKLQE